jgi:O-antigen/teichoic acid export membrane protein
MTSLRQRLDLNRLVPIGLSQVVGLVCGLLGVNISSRLIPPADYGAYGVFLSFAPVGMWVVHAGLIKFVSRHWAQSPAPRALLGEVVRANFKKLPLLAVATVLAALSFAAERWPLTALLLFVSSALLSLALIAQTALQAARAHWSDFVATIVGSVSRTFLPLLLYALGTASIVTLETGFCLHAAIFALAAWWLLLRTTPRKNPPEPATQLTRVYDGPLFIALALAAWVLTAVNRWIVAGFFGAEATGYFTLAGNLTLIVTGMLGVIFMQYFQPGLFTMSVATPEERRALALKVDRIALSYAVLSLLGALALYALAPWLFGRLIGDEYRPALAYITGAGFFGAAAMTAQFYHVMLLAAHRERACGWVDLSTALLLIGGGVLGATFGGEIWFLRWLHLCPLIPWLLTRTLARRAIR